MTATIQSNTSIYTTRDRKFAAHLIGEGILPLRGCSIADETEFIFTDPTSSGTVLFKQFVEGLKPQYIHRAGTVSANGFNGFLETLSNGRYLAYRAGASPEYRNSWPIETGKVYCPPDQELVRERVVLLADGLAPYGTQRELFSEIKSFIHRYVDIPDFWESLLAHYILLTWVYDAFGSLPYVRFLGEHGTGKTRMLEVVREVCYRAIMASGAASTSAIFRIIDQWRGTFGLDEADFSESAEWSEITKILNNGYRRGIPVLRSEGSASTSYSPRSFYVYGPKILSTRKRFDDAALESRCLTFETVEKSLRPGIPLELPQQFFAEARRLRNKLLQWRFDNFARLVDTSPQLTNGTDLRLSQITLPLHAIATSEEFRDALQQFASDYGNTERSLRPQALVLDAIKSVLDARIPKDRSKPIEIKAICQHCDMVAENLGEARDKDYKHLLSPKKVGGLLRSMGFRLERKNKGFVVIVEPTFFEMKRKQYGLG